MPAKTTTKKTTAKKTPAKKPAAKKTAAKKTARKTSGQAKVETLADHQLQPVNSTVEPPPADLTLRTGAGRIVFVPSHRAIMTDKQLRLALAVDDDNPLLCAVLQLIDMHFAQASLDSMDPKLDARKGTYPGGRQAALSELKGHLIELRRPAPVR